MTEDVRKWGHKCDIIAKVYNTLIRVRVQREKKLESGSMDQKQKKMLASDFMPLRTIREPISMTQSLVGHEVRE